MSYAEEFRECTLPGRLSRECGSKYKQAAKKCCPGLVCKDKRCVIEETSNPSSVESSEPSSEGDTEVTSADERGLFNGVTLSAKRENDAAKVSRLRSNVVPTIGSLHDKHAELTIKRKQDTAKFLKRSSSEIIDLSQFEPLVASNSPSTVPPTNPPID